MQDFLIVFSTNEKYLYQALAMHEQLCAYGFEDYSWVVPLENLKQESLEYLRRHFKDRIASTLQMPSGVKLSGNKIFLPNMVPNAEKYVVIDTDILILNRGFIDAFLGDTNEHIVILSENFSWEEWLLLRNILKSTSLANQDYTDSEASKPKKHRKLNNLIENEFFYLRDKLYVQTGSFGIPHQVYQDIFDSFVLDLTNESRLHRGDLIVWNNWVSKFSELFHLISPHNCLVLRPDASGPSSKLHLPNLSYKNGVLLYHNSPIMALHFTNSKGVVRTWKDYEQIAAMQANKL